MKTKSRAKKVKSYASDKIEKTDKYQQVTDKIIELLKSEKRPWIRPWSATQTQCQNLITNHIYKGCNPILCSVDMLLCGYELPYFVGFNQAKELNWQIKKGSKATSILFAGSFNKEIETSTGETENKTFFTNRWYNVFNVECFTDSSSDKKITDYIAKINKKTLINQDNPIETFDNFIRNQKAKVTFGGDKACYFPVLDSIKMPHFHDFSDARKYYSTFVHELTHWSGHETRLKRNMSGDFGSKKYAFEELIAELGSAYVCNELADNWDLELQYHANYLNSWIEILKEDKNAFFKASSLAQKACNFLLENSKSLVEPVSLVA